MLAGDRRRPGRVLRVRRRRARQQLQLLTLPLKLMRRTANNHDQRDGMHVDLTSLIISEVPHPGSNVCECVPPWVGLCAWRHRHGHCGDQAGSVARPHPPLKAPCTPDGGACRCQARVMVGSARPSGLCRLCSAARLKRLTAEVVSHSGCQLRLRTPAVHFVGAL